MSYYCAAPPLLLSVWVPNGAEAAGDGLRVASQPLQNTHFSCYPSSHMSFLRPMRAFNTTFTPTHFNALYR